MIAEDVPRGVEAPAELALDILRIRIAVQRHGGEHVEQQSAQIVRALQVAPELEDQHAALPVGNESMGFVFIGICLAGRNLIERYLVFSDDRRAHLAGNVRRSRGNHRVQRLSVASLHIDAGHQATVLRIPCEVIQFADAFILKQRGFVLHRVAQRAIGHLSLCGGESDAQQQNQEQSPFLQDMPPSFPNKQFCAHDRFRQKAQSEAIFSSFTS